MGRRTAFPVGSRTGAPVGEASRPCHVSSPLHVARSMRISRTARPHLLHVRAYGTYHTGATFGRSCRTRYLLNSPRVSYSHGLLHRSQPKPFRFRACARWRLTFFFSTQSLM